MKKLYNEFFHVPEDGKLDEKVMLAHVVFTVALMVACLTAMSLTAYAYFTSDVTSSANIIAAASYDIDIEIVKNIDENTTEEVLQDKVEGTVYTLSQGTYTITITKDENTSATTGYCIIKMGNGVTIYTQQIGVDREGKPESMSFAFVNTEDQLKLSFTPNWGTCVVNASTTAGTTENTSVKTGSQLLAYEVKQGDTLAGIAGTYGVKQAILASFNDIEDPELIYEEQIIYIPIEEQGTQLTEIK